jgi:hypothetical protein
MCAGASFQKFRCFNAGEFARAIAKDFGQVRLCNHRKVLGLFRRS